jgi:hypothetical protein
VNSEKKQSIVRRESALQKGDTVPVVGRDGNGPVDRTIVVPLAHSVGVSSSGTKRNQSGGVGPVVGRDGNGPGYRNGDCEPMGVVGVWISCVDSRDMCAVGHVGLEGGQAGDHWISAL